MDKTSGDQYETNTMLLLLSATFFYHYYRTQLRFCIRFGQLDVSRHMPLLTAKTEFKLFYCFYILPFEYSDFLISGFLLIRPLTV